ncbi:MAG: hypothetical protein HY018_01815 [Hydrogenophilales bacterium]|nr:hypothetical protein [Hydrogenophilales bacterium]
MAADQAAGLRRHSARQPARCIHVFSDSPDTAASLAQALHQAGRAPLLVDMQGRLFADAPARSLFDWRQQLQREQLQTLPLAYGAGWYAPGVRADEPALSAVANGYDHVIFDVGWGSGLALLPGAAHTVLMEIRHADKNLHADEPMLRTYALLKTLACLKGTVSVGLLGDRLACDHVRAASCRFLEQRFAHAIFSLANEDDAFAALAVRMADEETSLRAC